MIFLHSHGVGTARAVRIFKTYGADAIQVMTENPYRLARDIRGFGFETADAISMKLGIEKTAMIRVRAARALINREEALHRVCRRRFFGERPRSLRKDRGQCPRPRLTE